MRFGRSTKRQVNTGEITPSAPGYGRLSFSCNICGRGSSAEMAELDREKPSCESCGSNVRWRAIVHLLSVGLFGRSLALPDFPVRRDIVGVGMSDWDGYAVPLSRKLGYKNTFYHQEPKLDITSIDPAVEGSLDFIISSDVFERVPPPVSAAFENARRLLKPGGVLLLTVPYSKGEKTLEHFPELYDYQIVDIDGRLTLRNVTRDGVSQTFDDLIFHGGDGATLEMRVFSESALKDEFSKAGFKDIAFHRAPCYEHGVYWADDWSLPVSARNP